MYLSFDSLLEELFDLEDVSVVHLHFVLESEPEVVEVEIFILLVVAAEKSQRDDLQLGHLFDSRVRQVHFGSQFHGGFFNQKFCALLH